MTLSYTPFVNIMKLTHLCYAKIMRTIPTGGAFPSKFFICRSIFVWSLPIFDRYGSNRLL